LIVSVNEAWTKLTRYAQMEVEGKELAILDGERTDPDAGNRSGKPLHRFDEIAKGRCACSTNVHYDKEGREFIDFTCSYPLTNANDEVTHILHVYKELPEPSNSSHHGSNHGSESSSPPNQ
jgi:PAS domain-containing protein